MNKTLLVLAIVLLAHGASSQDIAPSVISIDFLRSASVPKYQRASFGSKIVVEIRNLNRSLYKVNGSVTQSEFNTELPAIFSGIELPGYLSLDLPMVAYEDNQTLLPPKVSLKEAIEKNFEIIGTAALLVDGAQHYNNLLINAYRACNTPYDTLENRVVRATADYLGKPYGNNRVVQAKQINDRLTLEIESAVAAEENNQLLVPEYLRSLGNGQSDVAADLRAAQKLASGQVVALK
jgi:hypothetical protein